LLPVLIISCLLVQPVFSIEIAGVKLPEIYELSGEQVQLNGYGIRKKFFFKVYLGSLYTGQKATSSIQVLESTTGQLIRLNFLYSKLEKARMVGGFAKGIEANSPELLKDPAVEQFLGWFDADFIEGDQLDLAISADNLVNVSHNDRLLGTIKSANLARAILLIYLGENPIDDEMKKGMLGNL
jgi:hypothetical protein